MRLALIIILSLLLSSCGFKLAGTNQLPARMQQIYIHSHRPYSRFEVALKNEFKAYAVKVSADSYAPLTLNLINTAFVHDNMNIVSNTQATVYHFYYTATFNLVNKRGIIIIPPTTISSHRTITFNPNEVIDASNETLIVEDEMLHDVIFKMFLVLNAKNTRTALNKA
jgi:LPS-assembly lipoprotein